MKKLFLTLTLLLSVSAFGTIYANDFGGGYDNSHELSGDAADEALELLGLKGDRRTVLTYDTGTQQIVVRIKKALRTFVAFMIEKKVYQTGEELTDLDRSLGEALKAGDEAFKAWLKTFFETDFHGLRHDGESMPQAETIYKTWKEELVDKGLLDVAETDQGDDN